MAATFKTPAAADGGRLPQSTSGCEPKSARRGSDRDCSAGNRTRNLPTAEAEAATFDHSAKPALPGLGDSYEACDVLAMIGPAMLGPAFTAGPRTASKIKRINERRVRRRLRAAAHTAKNKKHHRYGMCMRSNIVLSRGPLVKDIKKNGNPKKTR